MNIPLRYLLLCSLCTNSFALPIELDTYRHKLSKDEIKEVLAGYDAETLKEVLAEAGLYDDNPQYDFSIKVASKESGTYSAHDERRDGDVAVGEYSYIDPTGALVKVNYTADNDGYHVDRWVQEGFLSNPNQFAVVEQPPKPIVPVTQPPRTTRKPTPTTTRRTSTTSKPKNNFDLVASIIKQLTPHVAETVSSSLGGNKGGGTSFVKPKPTLSVPPLRVTIPKPKLIPTLPPVKKPIVFDFINTVPEKTEDDEDLVARIISQLTPHITASVSSSLGGKSPANPTTYIPASFRTTPNVPSIIPSTLTSSSDALTPEQDNEYLINKLIQDLTPTIKDSVGSSLKSADDFNFDSISSPNFGGSIQSQTNQGITPLSLRPKTNQASDEALVDAILKRLTPSIKSNVGSLLGKNKYAIGNRATDGALADEVISSLTPSIISNVRGALGNGGYGININDKNIGPFTQKQTPQGIQTLSFAPKPNQASDEALADAILKKLTPSIQSSIGDLLGKNQYAIGNPSTDGALADDLISSLTPSIISNVRDALGSGGYGISIDDKNIGTFTQKQTPQGIQTLSLALKPNQASDEALADAILKKLTPSIQSNIGDLLGKNQYAIGNPSTDGALADDLISSLTPSIISNVRDALGNGGYGISIDDKNIGTFTQKQTPQGIKPLSLLPKSNEASDEALVDAILRKLTPSIQSNVAGILGKNQYAIGNPSTDGALADEVISSLTPSIIGNVRDALGNGGYGININDKNIGPFTQKQSSQGVKSVSLVPKTSQASDEALADAILLKLTPSIKNNVGQLLGQDNYGIGNGNSNQDFISKIIEQLTPSIKSSVASTLKVTEDTSSPNLGGIIQPFRSPAINLRNIPPEINLATDDGIVDAILSQLTPSIVSNVRKSFGKNKNIGPFTQKQTSQGAKSLSLVPKTSQASDEALADAILLKLTPSIKSNVGQLLGQDNYGIGNGNSNQDFISKIIGQLTPSIKSSVASTLKATEDTSSPNLGGIIQPFRSPAINLGNLPPKINLATDDGIVDAILSQLTPSIVSNVRKSFGKNKNNDDIAPLAIQGKSSKVRKNKFPNFPEISDSTTKVGEKTLAEQILAELSPFIEGSIASYFSNQDSQGSSGIDASVKDETFANNLVTELLPTIKTLVNRKLGNTN